MPIYEYLCPASHIFVRFNTVANHSPIAVCDCGETATQIIGAPLQVKVAADVCYDSPIDGKPITSWAARTEDLARSNCVEYDPGRKQDYERRIKDHEKALDESVSESVGMAVARMDTKTRGKLYSELTEQGTQLEIGRK